MGAGQDKPGHVTQLLLAVGEGRRGAVNELLAVVYEELRSLARRKMAGVPPSDTLQPTALVHEAYMRLLGASNPSFKDRKHFFRAAARAMRDIVVEQARRHAALKRGANRRRLSLEETVVTISRQAVDLLVLDEALTRLAESDKKSVEVVMLRFFSGLTGDETALALGVSPATVDRRWAYAKAWLHRALDDATN